MSRFWIALACLTLAACDDSITGGELPQGEARVLATSSVGGNAASAPTGRVNFRAQITLVDEAGQETRITSGAVNGEVRIEGADSALVAQSEVSATAYTRVRVEFASVDAFIEGGLSVDGVPYLGAARVDIGAEPVVVEAPINLAVEPNTSETLVIDLNAANWLADVDFPTSTVPATSFANAVRLSVR